MKTLTKNQIETALMLYVIWLTEVSMSNLNKN